MVKKVYTYPLGYNIRFAPMLVFCLIIIIHAINRTPSESRMYLILFVICLFLYCLALVVFEKRIIAKNITVDDNAISADIFMGRSKTIEWQNIKSLRYIGTGFYLYTFRYEPYLYAQIVGQREKIIIRREINDYQNLIKLI